MCALAQDVEHRGRAARRRRRRTNAPSVDVDRTTFRAGATHAGSCGGLAPGAHGQRGAIGGQGDRRAEEVSACRVGGFHVGILLPHAARHAIDVHCTTLRREIVGLVAVDSGSCRVLTVRTTASVAPSADRKRDEPK